MILIVEIEVVATHLISTQAVKKIVFILDTPNPKPTQLPTLQPFRSSGAKAKSLKTQKPKGPNIITCVLAVLPGSLSLELVKYCSVWMVVFKNQSYGHEVDHKGFHPSPVTHSFNTSKGPLSPVQDLLQPALSPIFVDALDKFSPSFDVTYDSTYFACDQAKFGLG